jgi:hypothetical protein
MRKKWLLFFCTVFLQNCVSSQELGEMDTLDQIWYDSLSTNSYVDADGEIMVLPENVRRSKSFNNGFGIVVLSKEVSTSYLPQETYIVIDSNQNVFDSYPLSDHRNRGNFKEGLFAYLSDGKLGYKDFNGWVIPPVWDDGGDFSDGLASVLKDKERFFINREGEVVLAVSDISNDILGRDTSLSDFVNGYARVTDMSDPNQWRTTYIDKSGNAISDFRNGTGTHFYEGHAVIQTFLGGPCYFINEDGETVVSIGHHHYLSRFSNGLAVVGDNKKFGYVNTEGEMVIPQIYNYATPFVDGFAAVSMDEPLRYPGFIMDVTGVARYGGNIDEGIGRYAIINTKGEEVVPPIYSGIPKIYEGGVARVTMLGEPGTEKRLLINLHQGGRIIDETEKFVRSFKLFLTD